MSADGNDYSIVFLGRFAGRDKPVGQALSQVFGFKEEWGMRVVGVSPCILLSGLTMEQASEIHAILAEVEQAGCKFQVEKGMDPGLTKLEWPSPPRLKGRLVSEYGRPRSAVIVCPHCGQPIELSAGKAAGTPAASAGATLPATGPVQGGYGDVRTPPVRQSPVHVPAAGPAGPQRQTPSAPTAQKVRPPSGPGVVPQAVPQVQMPSRPVPAPAPAGYPPPGPPPIVIAQAPQEDAELDELVPIGGAPAQQPGAAPRPPAAQQAGAPRLLPEVPLIERPQTAPSKPAGSPQKRRMGPMSLDDFEAGLAEEEPREEEAPAGAPALDPITGESVEDLDEVPPAPAAPRPAAVQRAAGPALPPAQRPPSAGKVPAQPVGLQQAAPQQQAQPARQSGRTGNCTVLVQRTSNPRLAPLLAEILKISTEEAQKLASRPIIAVARGISQEEADALKKRFDAIGVACQIKLKR
ncbi:MAG: hypothetical protein N3A38_15755 [Planctomycetota bacterium]|nr:hypothetical protein [Planctomycetota bacterium]